MSLSNTSRIEAIRTINHLSRRLGSNNSSRASMTYTSTSTSTSSPPPTSAPRPTNSTARHKGHPSHRSSHISSHSSTPASKIKGTATPSSPKKKKSSSKVKEEKSPRIKEESSRIKEESSTGLKEDKPTKPKSEVPVETKQERPATARQRPTVEFETPTSPPPKAEAKPQSRPVGIAQRIAAARENRISIASFASDSTKLGEIPDRKPRSRYYTPATPGSDEYNVPPLYPLRPYKVEASREKGFWGGLFGRKREG